MCAHVQGYHDKLLYCDGVPRSYKNLRMLCLPINYCEPVTAQATDEVVQPPCHSTDTTEGEFNVTCTYSICYLP